MMTPFDKQDRFLARMKQDYAQGLMPLSAELKPYFDWKCNGGALPAFTARQFHELKNKLTDVLDAYYQEHPDAYAHKPTAIDDDPWQSYRGYGKDCYTVSYLEAIDEELGRLKLMGAITC